MSKNYVQPGNVLNYVNTTAGALVAGAVVMIGALAAVLVGNALVGQTVSAVISGVFALPLKPATPLDVGAVAYLDPATGLIEGTEGGDKVAIGTVVTAAASEDPTVDVLLNNNSGGSH